MTWRACFAWPGEWEFGVLRTTRIYSLQARPHTPSLWITRPNRDVAIWAPDLSVALHPHLLHSGTASRLTLYPLYAAQLESCPRSHLEVTSNLLANSPMTMPSC